jgi:hypothetical protein
MRGSPIERRERNLSIWAARYCRARLPISASSSRMKLRSGERWSEPLVSRHSDTAKLDTRFQALLSDCGCERVWRANELRPRRLQLGHRAMTGPRSPASVLYSVARSRRASGSSPGPRALASRRPFALSRTRWPQRPRWLHGACDGRKHVRFATLRLDFAPRFFEPLSVDPKSETLPNSI